MEYKSFYKEVGGNEGDKCRHSTRLDVYGCGCQHDCSYCYAKSLLSFRGLWHPEDPAVADMDKVRRKVDKIPAGTILRLGGMTDCFQPKELEYRNTLQLINMLNERRIGYLIVTKSHLVAEPEYLEAMDKDLAHIQVTVTSTKDGITFEKASAPSKRVAAIEKLQEEGFDVAIRLSPFIPEFIDMNVLKKVRCDKALVEFLRVNTWIRKWFDIDYSQYSVKQSGYWHLPLEVKQKYVFQLERIFKEISVCEDETEAYEYWKQHVNSNPDDCCNLRKEKQHV